MAKSSQRLLWVLLAVLFLSALFYFILGGDREVVVSMTPNGFEPPEVYINPGTTVIFVNNDERSRWPASDVHPHHNLYPGSGIEKCGTEEEVHIFDACREIPLGGEYRFTFDEPGDWGFHDHIYPLLIGVVVVEGVSAVSDISSDSIGSLVGNGEDLKKLIAKRGPDYVMNSLVEETGGGSIVDCHGEAHVVGRVSYDIFGAEAFKGGNEHCHSGYYHGAMEAFLMDMGTGDLARNIDELCSIFSTRFGEFSCLHGVGHGVMAYVNYDLPEALDICDLLSTEFASLSCYGGVFMENIVTAQGGGVVEAHETEWVSDDPHFPCNAIGTNSNRLLECYKMQTSRMISLFGGNLVEVAEECLNAPKEMIGVCFSSFGRDIAGITLRSPEKIVESCAIAKNFGYFDNCIEGAVNVIFDFWGANVGDRARNLCRLLEAESERRCFGVLEVRHSEIK